VDLPLVLGRLGEARAAGERQQGSRIAHG
jgi:hypothetical protein